MQAHKYACYPLKPLVNSRKKQNYMKNSPSKTTLEIVLDKTSVANLRQNGFVNIAYPPDLRAAVKKAAESWEAFCSLPPVVKRGLPYSNGGAGVGYELKDGVGPNADRKENFDLTPISKQWLLANAHSVKSTVALQFIEDASELFPLLEPVALEFARRVEVEYGIANFAEIMKRSVPFVRFIRYSEGQFVGQEMANAHLDQSGCTLHLFESESGLQCLTPPTSTSPSEWVDMPVSEGETVIIMDMQGQLLSEGRLLATPHRVIATERTVARKRTAAVVFYQFAGVPVYDKDKHGRLQEKPAGFNFTMSHEEFKKLFKS